ncbi:glycosyltransferase [Sphingobium sp. AN558]|uniref:glycosyltransferase n=1 Tax=Sphingobium sp. AN558 TaxID=3133442 RepID=UPI0030C0BC40
MRIIVDFQGAQTGSRYRGIGRYSTSLLKAMISRGSEHEFIIVLNGQFAAGIERIRADLASYLPQSQIRVWQSPGPVGYFDDDGENLREVAEIMREHFIRSLEPDVILVTSLFEGLDDDAVLSIKKVVPDIPVACIFYDLTPLILPDEHFQTSPIHRRWYRDRIASLRKSDLLLAISESSRQEALTELDFAPEKVVNIFAGRDDEFSFKGFEEAEKAAVRHRFGLEKPFILYTGGLELNKNLRMLVEGLSYLPERLRTDYQFVCVGKRNPGEPEQILAYAQDPLVRDMIAVVGYVSQDDLIDLYNACEMFVFPSLREGFGLPALEAMACGAATIVSDRTSLPEILNNAAALFDPESPRAIGSKITQVLTNPDVKSGLASSGLARANMLTWEDCADRALRALEALKVNPPVDRNRRATVVKTGIFEQKKLSILVQKLDHHGDFFLGLPAMAKLRARYPHARIDALIGSWNRDAATASGLFDTIYTFDYFKAKSSDRPSLDDEKLAIFRDLPFYDYAVDLRRQSGTRFILFKVNADYYFGYKTGDDNLDNLLTSALEIHPENRGERRYFEETHTAEQLLRIIDTLPFDVNDYLHLPDMGKRLPARPGAVAVFPRVGLDARQWDSTRFGLLLKQLAAEPSISEINVYAGKAEELDIIPIPDHAKLRLHCGLPFGDLYTSLSGNQICVGNNSFGVHLASYAGCRTIGIYSGHELSQQWGPAFNEAKAVMVDAACAPCHLPDRESCAFDMFCLEDISVKTVFDLVLAEVAGEVETTYRSEIVASNPASAIQSLVNDLNKHRARGLMGELRPEQKLAVSAAVTLNFPERTRSGSVIYVDMSNFRRDVHVQAPKTDAQWRVARALVEGLRRSVPADYEVVTIASGQHDHEFYALPFAELEDLTISLRDAKVVRPIAGDIYLGIDSYLFRNAAQWDLLFSWRALGVSIAFLLSDTDMEDWRLARGEGEDAALMDRFLRETMHFDLLVTGGDRDRSLEDWVAANMPPRERPIAVCNLGSEGRTSPERQPGIAKSAVGETGARLADVLLRARGERGAKDSARLAVTAGQ